MTIEKIEKFLSNRENEGGYVNVHFKGRNIQKVLFVAGKDYDELKEKNFWRIVSAEKAKQWESTRDQSLVRIYSGTLITKLS